MPTTPDVQAHGAGWTGEGVRFSLRSRHAEQVEVCLFDTPDAEQEARRVGLRPRDEGYWSVWVPELAPGQLYGFRVGGPWDPTRGHRFNAAKLLVDPAALALCGSLTWCEALQGHHPTLGDTIRSDSDSAPWVPKAVVVDGGFDWEGDTPPRIPWRETVLYECHVRGMTRLHPEVPESLRGTYLGLCHEAVTEHLRALGVTAVQLLPVQHFVSEEFLERRGLSNYFGYNPLGWFAPHAGYASADHGQQVTEFKTMVKRLHRAGLEVLLDVVFNHTAEGNHQGPTLSLRGIDNRCYYRLHPQDPRHYANYSGCGNTLHFGREEVVDMVLSCLRYWVSEMHVDGFRFDLAAVLGREQQDFDARATFFERARREPVLESVKLVAEPWDLGPKGYRLGQFPAEWSEWNDQYRDAVRSFWRGDTMPPRDLSRRLEGSPDLFGQRAGSRRTSINYVASHDGFSLQDLVSYERKHNWNNGEQNRDGHDHNLSCNWGVEGATDSLEIIGLRAQIQRNLLATLAFSRGVPMLRHGDEMGHTQQGNNNPYCQDNELTWLHWERAPAQQQLQSFTRSLFALRRRLALSADDEGQWISAHGEPLTQAEWRGLGPLAVGWLRRQPATGLLIFNAAPRGCLFELPDQVPTGGWRLLLNTAGPAPRWLRGHALRVPGRALLLLSHEPEPETPM